MTMSPEDHIKKLITNYTRRVQKLREQQAIEGISIDPKILIEIEDIEAEIEKLQKELRQCASCGNSENTTQCGSCKRFICKSCAKISGRPIYISRLRKAFFRYRCSYCGEQIVFAN